ncbi:MAG: phosphoenolpyruvate mutase [Ectobacillus sp.]
MKKSTQLRNLINSNQLEFIMEAHHALSAKIVEETGFKAIWASGLSISAALGVRDNNEASWTQVLEVLEFMSDATSIPILLDGDTGYGNFNNARRLVKKLEQRNIAGVCIEDKLFPKTNSFIKGEAQPLADINEFCNKIKAMKDSQQDADFVVVARVEAFIAGWGLEEALRRAEAYRLAGADAVLIHSKRSDCTEIEAFMKEWNNRLPVIIVPTKYYTVPTGRFRDMGVSAVIWANHNLRASISAMQNISQTIYQDGNLLRAESCVAPLEEVFRLQGAQELAEAEKKYLPGTEKKVNVIMLMKPVEEALAKQQLKHLNKAGIKDIHLAESSNILAEELRALYESRDKLGGHTIISSSNIVYKPYVLDELLSDENDITLIVDADFERGGNGKLFVSAAAPYSKMLYSKTVDLEKIADTLDESSIHGEFIGMWKVSGKGAVVVKEALEQLAQREDFHTLTLADLLNHICNIQPIAVKYIKGLWLDGDTFLQLEGGEAG